MSVDAISLVKSHQFGSTARKVIMLILADYADVAGSSFAGQARIAAEAEMGERSVRRHLAEFEGEGLIVREHRGSKDGGRSSDRLRIVFERVKQLPASLATRPELPANQDRVSGQSLAGEPSVEPSVTTSLSEPSSDALPEVASLCTQLAERWSAHSGQPKPKPTGEAWTKPMRLLLQRGVSSWETPVPIEPKRVARVIDGVFDRLATPDRSGFCWANQIRTPSSLRHHWDQLILALNGSLHDRPKVNPQTGRPRE